MRHQHRDRVVLAEDAGDVVRRAVRVRLISDVAVGVAVAEQHAVGGNEFLVPLLSDLEATLAVGDRDLDHVAFLEVCSPRCVGAFDPQMDVFTLEPRAPVRRERALGEAGLTADLCAVADAEDGCAVGGRVSNLVHDRRASRHRAGPEIIAVGEATGNHDAGGVGRKAVLVPDAFGVDIEISEGANRIAVAVRAAELDDRDRHADSAAGAADTS